MTQALLFSVRLHEGWYHGSGEIPSPARFFQSLIAGQGLSGPIDAASLSALRWLEQQTPPIIGVPKWKRGQNITNYVPNNDLDSVKGDHRAIGEIRVKKQIQPMLFEPSIPFLFAWRFEADSVEESKLRKLVDMADGVYQFGRTVDMAWAHAEVIDADQLAERIEDYSGKTLMPTTATGACECLTVGSLAAVIQRHDDLARRYGIRNDRKGQTFRRRSKLKWKNIAYASRRNLFCFDLIPGRTSTFKFWEQCEAANFVQIARDGAIKKLKAALPEMVAEINRLFLGKSDGESKSVKATQRVKILPLPSIGHEQADQHIRRVLLEIPNGNAVRRDDIAWAFSGLKLKNSNGAEFTLTKALPNQQLKHYGMGTAVGSLRWQTVTPVALKSAARRRIEPDRKKRKFDDLKGGSERTKEAAAAITELRNALRHAGVNAKIARAFVQKEPWTKRGQRSEDFASNTRFSKHILWHVDIEFDRPVPGPICIGDGRFVGLGLLRPITSEIRPYVFEVVAGLLKTAQPETIADCARRAVMSIVRDQTRSARLDPFFSGHEEDGRATKDDHLAFSYDPAQSRLLVIPPITSIGVESDKISKQFSKAMNSLDFVNAGRSGKLQLKEIGFTPKFDSVFGRSSKWKSLTMYAVNRHLRRANAELAIEADVLDECNRRGFPPPSVTVVRWQSIPRFGLVAELELKFDKFVSGPLLLGKTRHKGGGLFEAVRS